MNRQLKRYVTRYYLDTLNGRKCFVGCNILAFSWTEATQKIDIQNKFSYFQLILDGEFILELS